MAKFQSPLLGYNNNVRHKNRVFHIQTEDSGVGHPHIITHLFMDGGRILKSVKTSYAEHVGTDGMKDIVRGMMKEQHKAMFIALRDGQYDHIVDPGAAAAAAAKLSVAPPAPAGAPSAAPPALDAAAAAVVPVVAVAVPVPTEQPALDAAAVAVTSSGPPTSPDPVRVEADLPPNTIDETNRPAVDRAPPPSAAPAKAPLEGDAEPPPSVRNVAPAPVAPAPIAPAPIAPAPAPVVPAPIAPRVVLPDPEDVPMTTRQPPEARPDAVAARATSAASALSAAIPRVSPSGRELTLDFDALERAAQEPATPSASLFNAADLPPPPKNLFAAKEPGSGGIYRTVEAEGRRDPREEEARPAAHKSTRAQPAAVPREESPSPGRAAPRISPAGRPAGEARYAPARPAAIFGNTQRPQPQSLFSDELVSDKSLDEVILSYLAEDLEPPRRK